ncbi:MAG TPA: class I SAM-dependent methyltransferase [Polyangiaceae bacterium]|jgi:SAM-dependent methyltransferase
MTERTTFEELYATGAPWDTGRPQRALAEMAERITGSILDAGCGTGENALFLAERGHSVMGIDFLEEPIQRAKRKCAERGLKASFLVKNALTLEHWTERFDTVLDSGLFHVFDDDERERYVQGLSVVLKPGGRLFLLCFSDEVPGTQGPRRVSQLELREAFAQGWTVESIERSRFEVRPEFETAFPGGPQAWFLVAQRTDG